MAASDDEESALVIDNGSSVCRIGFAGEEEPKAVFSSVVGKPKFQPNLSEENYVGEHAQMKREYLTLGYPTEHGIVTNWDDMEKIWRHGFSDLLRVSPTEYPVLISEAPLNPKANREIMTQVMFERFQTPAFFVANHAVLSLWASGKGEGVVLDIGDGVCDVLPFSDGFIIRPAVQRIDLAGRDLTEYLMTLLAERGYSFSTTAEREIVREIKEKSCYVSLDFNEELTLPTRLKDHDLPDGQVITIGNERFRAAEPLFRPSLLARNHKAVHELVYESIMKCDIDLRKKFYSQIILSGGTTMLGGFPERLEKEVSRLAPAAATVSVKATPDRREFVWIGGSILASSHHFPTMWITKEEYEEHGPCIVHRKCLN